MNPRSKKYYEHSKAQKDSKKDVADKNGFDEQKGDQSNLRKNSATQDDTGGGNNSGKRIDDN